MQHRFYCLTPHQQKRFQLSLAALFLLINLFVAMLLLAIGLPFVILLVLSVSLSIFAPFVDVPAGVKQGKLVYLSPLLLTEKMKNGCLTLHGGSLFDYYFVLDFDRSPHQRKRQIIQGYFEGLLKLIEQYESSQPNTVSVRASSYILAPKTANKLGLKVVETDMLQRFILYFNFVNLTCCVSLMNGKLSFPSMTKIYTFEGQMDDLIGNKDYIRCALNKITPD